MAHISIDIDDDIKARAEAACQAMGITLEEVVTDRVTELARDPFYNHLRAGKPTVLTVG